MSTYLSFNVDGTFASEAFRLVAEGHRLSNCLINEKEVYSVMDCVHLCLSAYRQCKSINYEKQKKQHGEARFKCQLNNKRKEMEPKIFVPDSAFNYYEPVNLEYSDCLEHRQTKGDAGDSLARHNGMMFSTKDKDNDNYDKDCAWMFKGAWWYKNCHDSNLNGLYLGGIHTSYADGVNWRHWKDHKYSLKKTEMKIQAIL